jgi:hypothetical protein
LKPLMASARLSIASMSKWLVGSSSSIMLWFCSSSSSSSSSSNSQTQSHSVASCVVNSIHCMLHTAHLTYSPLDIQPT